MKFGQILLVKEGELKATHVDQLADLLATQRANPVESLDGIEVLSNASRSDHATVTNQDYAIELKALAQLVDLSG